MPSILTAIRGVLFRGFPSDTQWVRGRLESADFDRLKYFNGYPWTTLTRRTRLVADGARNLDSIQVTDGADSHSTNAHIHAVLAELRKGARFPDLILAKGETDDLIVVEGHARATAYVAAGVTTPVWAFVGSSPRMKEWVFY